MKSLQGQLLIASPKLFDPNFFRSVILLVQHGIYIIENLNLEELAQDKCYEFTLIVLPLKIQGATGSPVRPIAVASSG